MYIVLKNFAPTKWPNFLTKPVSFERKFYLETSWGVCFFVLIFLFFLGRALNCTHRFINYNITKPPKYFMDILNDALLKCPNKTCFMKIKFEDVKEHDSTCTKLKVTCDACNKEMNRGNLENHKIRFKFVYIALRGARCRPRFFSIFKWFEPVPDKVYRVSSKTEFRTSWRK